MDHTLLLVDDEKQVLASLERLLRGEKYNILKANSAQEGLQLLESNSVGVIMTDQQMPEMTGVEFLSQVRKLHPDPVRMVLTGHADLDAVTQAVNRGAIYKFMVKPWESESLKANIREAFQHYELMREKEQLSREIQRANGELRNVNQALEEQISQKTRQLVQIAQYDSVTNLPNRLLFTDRLSQAVDGARATGKAITVAMIGLDRFKLVNETYGHLAGDKLLCDVAERLMTSLRPGDTLARLGGDQFAMVLTDLNTTKQITEMVSNIQGVFQKPCFINGSEVHVSASIGISMFPQDGMIVDDLIKNSNTAMHHAKEEGERYRFYTSEMNRRAAERLLLENELRQAVSRGEFVLYYQPQIDIASGRISGVEALIRWIHPEKGLISPAVFIPVLEDTGLIEQVGEWVIREAYKQGKEWDGHGLFMERISVNLSVRQFQGDRLLGKIRDIIDEFRESPMTASLEIEVTESLLIRNVDKAIEHLNELDRMGIRIAIDDFGTGYASLSYLTRFPVHSLKIDRSFISRLQQNTNDALIVTAIIAMAHSLGLTVVAEGVETEQQLEFLRMHDCDLMQGYLYSGAVPAEDITRILQLEQRHSVAT